MRKAKKSPKVQYGIQITKPWSKEMYDHNDIVSEEMKKNIIKKWNTIVKRLDMDQDWNLLSDDSEIVKLQKGICYSGYGDGFTLEDVDEEFRSEVENMPNYQLHETYSYLAFERMLPRTSFMLIGFEWEKFDYHVIGSQEMLSPVVTNAVADKVVDQLMKDSIDA
jgi:hypothetical protein